MNVVFVCHSQLIYSVIIPFNLTFEGYQATPIKEENNIKIMIARKNEAIAFWKLIKTEHHCRLEFVTKK